MKSKLLLLLSAGVLSLSSCTFSNPRYVREEIIDPDRAQTIPSGDYAGIHYRVFKNGNGGREVILQAPLSKWNPKDPKTVSYLPRAYLKIRDVDGDEKVDAEKTVFGGLKAPDGNRGLQRLFDYCIRNGK